MASRTEAAGPLERIRPFDVFVGGNVALLLGTTLFAYARADWEFALYAVVILAFIVFLWRLLRPYDYPVWLLVLVEIGILAHFAGGFLRLDGDTLYTRYVLGVRWDKYVHYYNSLAVAMLISHLVRKAGLELKGFGPVFIVMVTLGLGGVIEIVEYFAVAVIPKTGVGDYANNIEDLIMNLLGGTTGVSLSALIRRSSARREAAA
jgi:hypothetical protein